MLVHHKAQGHALIDSHRGDLGNSSWKQLGWTFHHKGEKARAYSIGKQELTPTPTLHPKPKESSLQFWLLFSVILQEPPGSHHLSVVTDSCGSCKHHVNLQDKKGKANFL